VEKTLALYSELCEPRAVAFMEELNVVARRGGLTEYTTYSRIWEYPWLWFHLKDLPRNARVLDIGSERSPFPWYLRTQGFDVIVSDVTGEHWDLWKEASRRIGVSPRLRILDSQDLALATASVDVYESISILEHVPDKAKAIEEAGRVLRPGGLLLLTFDVCEADMGMSFPDWNGRAVSMREFDGLFANSPWFEAGLPGLKWNAESIPDYLNWHRTTAPHHNYVTGAIAIRRNQETWPNARKKDPLMDLKGTLRTVSPSVNWHIRDTSRRIKRRLPRRVHSLLKSAKARLSRKSQPLETLPDCPDLFRVYRRWIQNSEVRRQPGGWEYKGKFYPDYLTVGGACHAIFREALKHCQGAGIDVGAGLWPLPGAVPVDIWRGPGARTTISEIPDGSQDFVFSSHCLEHNEDWQNLLKNWIGKLKPGGAVFLYLPHPECGVWEVGSPFVGNEHKWTPTPQVIKARLEAQTCKIVACDDGPDAMYSFWVCARREA